MNTFRVLVFGATGTGKTSLCNILTGKSRPTNNGAQGVTAKTHRYSGFIEEGRCIEIVDTVGLHESNFGTVPADKAIVQLVELLENSKEGFNLLIHVTRASRITEEHEEDYKFFVEKMTQGNIPVILVVTGCENESPMQVWIERNRRPFERFSYKEIIPTCLASGGPMEAHFAPLREESRRVVIQSIARDSLPKSFKIYGDGTGKTFSQALTRIWNDFVDLAGLPEKFRGKVNESAYGLMKRLGVPKAIASAAVAHIPDLVEEIASKFPFPLSGKVARSIAEKILGHFMKSRG